MSQLPLQFVQQDPQFCLQGLEDQGQLMLRKHPREEWELGGGTANFDEFAVCIFEDLTGKQSGADTSLELDSILVATAVNAVLH